MLTRRAPPAQSDKASAALGGETEIHHEGRIAFGHLTDVEGGQLAGLSHHLHVLGAVDPPS